MIFGQVRNHREAVDSVQAVLGGMYYVLLQNKFILGTDCCMVRRFFVCAVRINPLHHHWHHGCHGMYCEFGEHLCGRVPLVLPLR